MKRRYPLVSIIIVNWNGGQVFGNCLSTLAKVHYSKIELIVIDNGSTDGSEILPLKYRRFSNAKIIKNRTNTGFANANNQGADTAKGKYILLLNNDTKVTPDFLLKLVAKIEKDPQVGVIQPKIFLYDNPGYLDNAGSYLTRIGFLKHWGFMQKDGPEFSREEFIFSAKGACMLIRRSILSKIGGLFDKDFFSYFEESDFCWRVWLGGYKVLYHPQAIIEHKLGFTIRRLDVTELNYHYYKNRIRSLIKNLNNMNLVIILLPHLVISLGIAIVFLIRLKFRNAKMILDALSWNLQNLSKTIKLRREIQAKRVVSDEVLFQNLSRGIDWLKYWHDFKRVEEDSVRSTEKAI